MSSGDGASADTRHPSCQDPGTGPGMLQVSEALERILGELTPVTGTQTLPLRAALDRILVAPVTATVDVPSGDQLRHGRLCAQVQ